ncbi:unnamed protein product [Adineta steineri]|uniref:Uncharacterized protein n=1 Tax=Adineta steineri TaxID=433720 RepID=A0A813YKR1_9BILA|nr:unnamed protein product [Adineta steineri]CAF1164413.1 unnamed protein product [Adineta steineri]
MKNLLFKLLSIQYNIFSNSKQIKNIQNKKQKNNEKDLSIVNLIQHIESLPKIIHHLFSKEINNYPKQSCCRRKTKIIDENNLLSYRHKQKNYNISYSDNHTHDTETAHFNRLQMHKQLSEKQFYPNDHQNSILVHTNNDNLSSVYQVEEFPQSQIKAIENRNNSMTPAQQKSLPVDTESDIKQLYNEMDIRELVNTVRTEMSALIDADRNPSKEQMEISTAHNRNLNSRKPVKNKSKIKKSGKRKTSISRKSSLNSKTTSKSNSKSKSSSKTRKQKVDKVIKNNTSTVNTTEQCNNCCCNFLHYSLRQIMRDAEQMKQFALNNAMIGIDPLKLKSSNKNSYPAICIPMYNCENIRDQRFPTGPTFTTISKDEEIDENNQNQGEIVIQDINTQHGKIQIKLDPQSFGLAPFFSHQYETFIKGPPSSIFFTSYINKYHK